jgi:hypothetical protein
MSSNKIVIGGGSTVAGYPHRYLTHQAHVYGINDAALWTDVHTCITMDRLWFENRWPYLKAKQVMDIWIREGCDKNVKVHHGKVFKHLRTDYLQKDEGTLAGSNSGACALNLAYQHSKRGDNIYLLGFDMCKGPNGEPYWYPPYPWTQPAGATKPGHFRDWVVELSRFHAQLLVEGINVYNVTHRSELSVFPKISFDQMKGMLDGGC